MKKVISIRVDIDTLVGLKKGVPKLLKLFDDHGIKVTFFCVMGPDTMGQHAHRFKKKGYFRRILRANPFKLIRSYGIAPFFYGTLLPSPLIGRNHPDLLKAIVAKGHELGIHGFNHAGWADHYSEYDQARVDDEWSQTIEAFRHVFGSDPESSAAPNWRSHERLFKVEDKAKILYASDMRGFFPFRPKVDRKISATLQIPVTLPCTHELKQFDIPKEQIASNIISELQPGINVWTIHDWYEGLNEGHFVSDFIRMAKEKGYRFVTMKEIAKTLLKKSASIPVCRLEDRPVNGGIGTVTWQVAK